MADLETRQLIGSKIAGRTVPVALPWRQLLDATPSKVPAQILARARPL